MVRVNVKHGPCGHWHQHSIEHPWRTACYYASRLALGMCPGCYARDTALDVAREVFSESRGTD
jgi:hypothetical protein